MENKMNIQSVTAYVKKIAAKLISRFQLWAARQPSGFSNSSFAKQWASADAKKSEKQSAGKVNELAEQHPQASLATAKAKS